VAGKNKGKRQKAVRWFKNRHKADMKKGFRDPGGRKEKA
jgi:hypothetical protein